MGDDSMIEWCDATWNPVVGCTAVSEGCRNCYAKREHDRRHKGFLAGAALPKQYAEPFGTVQTLYDRLDQPLRWKRPRRIFVNSVSDLYHEDVPDSFIYEVYSTMYAANWHTFQVLTKRPKRRAELLTMWRGLGCFNFTDPPAHIWEGVSVEDQKTADERIPWLRDTPAAVRWLSCEPILGPIDAFPWLRAQTYADEQGEYRIHKPGIDWVVAGGESGPKARPMHPEWPRGLRDQCESAKVPFLMKQWGEWGPKEAFGYSQLDMAAAEALGEVPRAHEFDDGARVYRVGKKRAGRLLDGVLHDTYPVEAQP